MHLGSNVALSYAHPNAAGRLESRDLFTLTPRLAPPLFLPPAATAFVGLESPPYLGVRTRGGNAAVTTWDLFLFHTRAPRLARSLDGRSNTRCSGPGYRAHQETRQGLMGRRSVLLVLLLALVFGARSRGLIGWI
jgi:hypothetical protein